MKMLQLVRTVVLLQYDFRLTYGYCPVAPHLKSHFSCSLILNETKLRNYTSELHVKTVKYFKSIERVQDEVEQRQAELKARGRTEHQGQVGSME